jgi:hypothetical protein
VERLEALVTTFMQLGGQQVQINILDNVTLRAAQADPVAYAGLIVRAAGRCSARPPLVVGRGSGRQSGHQRATLTIRSAAASHSGLTVTPHPGPSGIATWPSRKSNSGA